MRLGTGESVVSLTWELSAPRIVAVGCARRAESCRGRLLRAAATLVQEAARWSDRSSGGVGWTCTGTPWPRACGCQARGASGRNTSARSGRRPPSCCCCATGWRPTRSPTWRWRARGCTGSPCSTSSRRPSRACWSTPPTSSRFRDGRPTCWIASGSRSCWSTGCCGAASCHRPRFGSSET